MIFGLKLPVSELLSGIIGDELIGYWHLMDQILFYQDYLEEVKSI